MSIMPVRKLSVALDDKTATAAAAAAQRRGVSLSAWLNEAADDALRVEAGLHAVAEWEAEHGSLTQDELDTADRFLTSSSRSRRRAS